MHRLPEPFWSVPEAAQRLGVPEGTLRSRVERGELVAERPPGGGLMIRNSELHRYEAAQLPTNEEQAPAALEVERPHFALVRAHQDSEPHGLAPGAEGGAALCGEEPGEAGWYLIGYTVRPLYLIPCGGCRGRAAALLAERRAEGAA
jgi:excisionase family DNA binding protein